MVMGATGGIGQACSRHLEMNQYQVIKLSSKDIDLNIPHKVFDLDLAGVDILVNCSGHSQGTYLGFLNNSWQNQLSQINVNFIANLFLLKHFAKSRPHGQFIWFSSELIDTPRPFHSVYASTKSGSKFAIDLIRQEAAHIRILEVKIGPTKTNFRYRNFQGTKSLDEVDRTHDQHPSLDADRVGQEVMQAILRNQTHIHIT